jgi:hypothetical protein
MTRHLGLPQAFQHLSAMGGQHRPSNSLNEADGSINPVQPLANVLNLERPQHPFMVRLDPEHAFGRSAWRLAMMTLPGAS